MADVMYLPCTPVYVMMPAAGVIEAGMQPVAVMMMLQGQPCSYEENQASQLMITNGMESFQDPDSYAIHGGYVAPSEDSRHQQMITNGTVSFQGLQCQEWATNKDMSWSYECDDVIKSQSFGDQHWTFEEDQTPQQMTIVSTLSFQNIQCQEWATCEDMSWSQAPAEWKNSRNRRPRQKAKSFGSEEISSLSSSLSSFGDGTCLDPEEKAFKKELKQVEREMMPGDAESAMADRLLGMIKKGEDPSSSATKYFRELAFYSKNSCHAAQKVLSSIELCDNQKDRLASILQGHICHGRRAVNHQHANYVLQKIVELLPKSTEFIVEEILGSVHEVAKLKTGCRVLQRILEHPPNNEITGKLMAELTCDIGQLCNDTYGGYVVRHLLQHGLPTEKHQVAVALAEFASWYAKQQLSSFVIEQAIQSCEVEDQKLLAASLLNACVGLSNNKSGMHVLEALYKSAATQQMTTEAIKRVSKQLMKTKYGKDVLKYIS